MVHTFFLILRKKTIRLDNLLNFFVTLEDIHSLDLYKKNAKLAVFR